VAAVINIPGQIQFSKSLSQCENIQSGPAACSHLVNIEPTILESLNIIYRELPRVDDFAGTIRVEPLVFSRLARGGKTTILRILFNALKESNEVYPIIISFNGSSNFVRRHGETNLQCILRIIALQFIDVAPKAPKNVICDENALIGYLATSDKPIVLLIDELNALACPLDSDASAFLKTEFLGKANRYLVYSTHVPMDIEATSLTDSMAGSSSRSYRTVHMPISTDLTELMMMFENTQPYTPALTRAEVAYYGGIPSLIYSVKSSNDTSPVQRFSQFSLNKITNEIDIAGVLIAEILSGNIQVNEHQLRQFDRFSSLAIAYYQDPSYNVIPVVKHWWPLCYLQCIFKLFRSLSLLSDWLPKKISSSYPDWMAWEVLIQIAIVIRCMDAQLNGTVGPFGIAESNVKPEALVIDIPIQYESLSDAYEWLNNCFNNIKRPAIVYFIPTHSRFEAVDGLLCYLKSSMPLKMYGIQVKLGRALPSTDVPDWITHSYLVRGLPSATTYDGRAGWTYLSDDEIKELLGYSLSFLYPKHWPDVPA